MNNSRDQTVYAKSISCKILKVTQDDDTPYVIAFIIWTFIILNAVHAKIVSGVTERIHNRIVYTKEDVQAYCQNAQK